MSKWLALLNAIKAGELNETNNQMPAGRPAEAPVATQLADKMFVSFSSPRPKTAIASAEAPGAAEPANKLFDSFNSTHPETPSKADLETLLALLREHGPMTYGAAASTLAWGASRAWRAEAELRAKGSVRLDHLGRMIMEDPA